MTTDRKFKRERLDLHFAKEGVDGGRSTAFFNRGFVSDRCWFGNYTLQRGYRIYDVPWSIVNMDL